MRYKEAIGEGIALGSIVVLLVFFVMLTYNGIVHGSYMIVIDSSIFYEHYIEFGLLLIGLFCYIS